MTTWHTYVQTGAPVPEWPYPIRYNKVNEVSTDVLILGGGIAGCHAAINALREGAKVVVLDKGNTKRSGQGGAGVDHWLGACTNPCSKVSPEEAADRFVHDTGGYTNGISRYITAKEGWDALLDCERMGVQIRDVNDEFKGADFRDDATKLLFAYDYVNRIHVRVWGHNMKPCLHKEMKRLGVSIYDRVMVTGLLSEGGVQGARIVGATGINVRTGEFYVFSAKATVVATNSPSRNWNFSLEQTGGGGELYEINNSGDGHAAAWKAGAEFVGMEQTRPTMGGLGYIPYGVGNVANTWHGAPLVDAGGKEVPWADRSGKEIKTIEERFRPGPGENFIIGSGVGINEASPKAVPSPMALPASIRKNEFAFPLYADLTRLPELERRAIFGLMVGNEGKTRIPVYDKLTKAGFDPDKDMLQAPVLPVDGYSNGCYWIGAISPTTQRNMAGGGFLVDWNLRTSLEGLYAAGKSLFGTGPHADAAATGRYAGRKAAQYALHASAAKIDRWQVDAERARCYAPLKQSKDGVGWKELNVGITRIMLDYCGMTKTEEVMKTGLSVLKDLKETEAATAYASNPHELGRLLECHSIIETSEIILNASLARKASSALVGFSRVDCPEIDPPDWRKWLPVRQEHGAAKVRELPLDYHLKPPYAPSYRENY